MTFLIKSPAFEDGATIPDAFSYDGGNASPELIWSGTPDGTKSYILVVEDPDAPVGTFTHWIAYNIPGDAQRLDQDVTSNALPQGTNDFGHPRYDGPQPPKGHGPHRYYFRLAALDTASLDLASDPDTTAIINAARMHVLAEAELVGLFERA